MKVLVIGGTQFIGRFVVSKLLQNNHKVTIFHRGEHEVDFGPEVTHIHGDRKNLLNFKYELLKRNFDALIDMIPMNYKDSGMVVEIFRGRLKHSVHISSQDVYAPWIGVYTGKDLNYPIPYTENTPLRNDLFIYRGKFPPLEDYEKITVERTIMTANATGAFPATILRLPAVYGPWDNQIREYFFIKRILDGRTRLVLGSGADWLWQRGYVEDIASAIVLVLENPKTNGQVYNVGHHNVWTVRQLATKIAEFMDWKWEIVSFPDKILPQGFPFPYRPHIVVDTSKIRFQLGFKENFSLETGLKATIKWTLEHPPKEVIEDNFNYELEDEIYEKYKNLV